MIDDIALGEGGGKGSVCLTCNTIHVSGQAKVVVQISLLTEFTQFAAGKAN